MTASEVLVIFLSVALAVFLVLGIVVIIFLIIIAKKIKSVAETAERTALRFEDIVASLQKVAAPAIVSKFVMENVVRFFDHGKKNKE